MTAPHQPVTGEHPSEIPVTIFGPDFPFPYDDWLRHPAGLGHVPADKHGTEVAIIGAGMAGITAAYELMKLGLKPVIYESRRLGGRLHSESFQGAEGVVAELGGMRFPRSSTGFYHYLDMFGLETRPFPNPLAPDTPSTVIDLEGQPVYVETLADLPPLLREVGDAWHEALEEHASFSGMQEAIRNRDVSRIKEIWNALVPIWDDRTFYGFIATSNAFRRRSFRHLEVFGQVGFGTGGWDTDFPNSMLEILRVAYTNCDEDQHFVVGGVEQVPRRLWQHSPDRMAHWPRGTTLEGLHSGAPRPGVARLERASDGRITVIDRWSHQRRFEAVLATCQSWLLTTHIDTDERLFSQKM
ncbi:MAG: FAD-dependent oxidoreductase, partial [Candidatus Competibacterales bacterium]|nr:FAD-dependent oxidoreductase [Candidatus Competibacterales bacterium]